MITDIAELKMLMYQLDQAQQVQEALERIPNEVKLADVATVYLTIEEDRQIPLTHVDLHQLFQQLSKVNLDSMQHIREMMHKVLESPVAKNPRIDEIPPPINQKLSEQQAKEFREWKDKQR